MGRRRRKAVLYTQEAARGSAKAVAGRTSAHQPRRYWPSWSSPWAAFLAGGLIVLATVVTYSNSFHGPFFFDDDKTIFENPTIRHLWPIWPALSPPANGTAVQRRPVVNLSLAINYAISGYRVWSYHALNLVAHVLGALVLFDVIRRTFLLPAFNSRFTQAATPLALTVALLWALHPLQTEAILYVVQRTEVLAGLFYLLTLYCVIRGSSAEGPAAWYAAAMVACALAMGSKESAISAPVVVLLFDRVFLSASWREVARRRWVLYLGLAASWAVILIMLPHGSEGAVVFQAPKGSDAAAIAGERGRMIDYTLAQCGVITHYLRLCFWPHPLLVDYGFYKPQSVGQIVPYVLLIGALIAATVAAFRWQPWLGFLGVWFFAILAPSSSFVPLFQQIAAEKRMYLPLAAVVTGVVVCGFLAGRWLVGRRTISQRLMQAAGGSLLVFTSIAFGVLSFQRNQDYRSTFSIWQDAVAKLPDNARAQNNLGLALVNQGRVDEGLDHIRNSIELWPDNAQAYYNLGTVLVAQGQPAKAIEYFQEALKIKPEYAEVYNNLGNLLVHRGQIGEAVAQYLKALEIEPFYADAHNNLGSVLASRGQIDEAISRFQKAIEIRPDFTGAYNNLGNALAERGRFPEAAAEFRAALELAEQQDQPALADSIRAKLRDCEAGVPLRHPPSAPPAQTK